MSSQVNENCGCVNHDHPGWHDAPPGCVCICGKEDGSASGYRSRRGNGIKSAIGGISHGVADFVVGSMHDLQTAAVYVGSSDLEISLYERMEIIQAVEESQASRLAAIGDQVIDLMAIDPSDSIYQSFHSTTTMGLEMGSLIAGGYGTVKGILAFNRLAKAPKNFISLAKIERNQSFQADIIRNLEEFIGKDSRLFKNNYKDLVIESKDGLRQFRIDFYHTAPHKNPHIHLIEYGMKKNKKFEVFNERIYPKDVKPE